VLTEEQVGGCPSVRALLFANCAHLVIVVLASHRRQSRSLVSAAVGADADALNVAIAITGSEACQVTRAIVR